MPSARSTTARPATRTRSRSSRHGDVNRHPSRGSPKRIVRRGSRRRLGRLAFVAGERARRLPRLGEDPGAARRLWAGACRRGAGGVRVQPALQRPRDPRGSPARPGRHEPAEPIVGTLKWDSNAPARGGGRLLAGLPAAAADLTTARVTAWKGTRGATAGHAGRAWVVKRAMRGLTDRLSHVFSTRYEDRTVDPAGPNSRTPQESVACTMQAPLHPGSQPLPFTAADHRNHPLFSAAKTLPPIIGQRKLRL